MSTPSVFVKCPRCEAPRLKPCVEVDDVTRMGDELSYIHPERVEEAARRDAQNANPKDLSPITDEAIVETGLVD
jgi:hypothetical protein